MSPRQVAHVVVLLAAVVGVQVMTIRLQSPIGDAAIHLASGFQAARYGENTLNWEHPPLVKMLGALPMAILEPDALPNTRSPEDPLGLVESVSSHPKYAGLWMTWYRAALLVFFVIPLMVGVYALGRLAAGHCGGLLLVSAMGLNYSVVGNLSTFQTDTALSAFTALSLWAVARLHDRPSATYALLGGLMLGLGMASKHTGVLVFALVAGWWSVIAWKRGVIARTVLPMAGAALCTVFFVYAVANRNISHEVSVTALQDFVEGRGSLLVADSMQDFGPLLMAVESASVSLAQWLTGLIGIAVQNNTGIYPTVAFGDFSMEGRWWYFPAALVVKTPLALILATVVALGVGRVLALRGEIRWFFCFVAVSYLTFALVSNYNIGLRHLYPILPLLYLPVLRLMHTWWIPPAIALALLVETLIVSPYWISATNTWWMGKYNPTAWSLAGSDLEYQQNFISLAKDVQEREGPIAIVHPLLRTGVLSRSIPDARIIATPPDKLQPGWYAVNVLLETYPDAVHSDPAAPESLKRLIDSWAPFLRFVQAGESHGTIGGTYHLYRVGEP